ncbi:Ubiquitin carboxyl-terminal hydrolase family protein [Ditylenchus destructor]|nr:Ubiquitin carboxyl-terminal hydrolase family protein [Ditylenchus destructor]
MSGTETETGPVVPEWTPERQILTDSGVDDKGPYKSEGTIELRIDHFAEFVRTGVQRVSAPMYIRRLPWRIMAYSKETDQSNNHDGQSPSKFLAFFLFCPIDYPPDRRWECEATFALCVMSQKDGVMEIVSKDAKKTFKPGFDGNCGSGTEIFVDCDYFSHIMFYDLPTDRLFEV